MPERPSGYFSEFNLIQIKPWGFAQWQCVERQIHRIQIRVDRFRLANGFSRLHRAFKRRKHILRDFLHMPEHRLLRPEIRVILEQRIMKRAHSID